MKAWFSRIRQAVAGRLMTLKHKFGKPQMQKFAALVHARLQAAREWLKESWLIVKCALLIFVIKLYMMLTPEALKSYWLWIKNLPSQFTRENFQKWYAAFLAWLKTLPETLRGLRKSGVLASLTLFALLLFMGHSATVAWFTYTTPVDRNTFQVGKMDLQVSYKNDKTNGEYRDLEGSTSVFNDKALYEPGYTQVVYFKIENEGSIAFDYKLSVFDYDFDDSTNVYGEPLHLPEYLYYGVKLADSEDELNVSPRTLAREIATTKVAGSFENYYEISDEPLEPGETKYAALVVWMPEYIGNEANHKTGFDAPQVILGIKVYAQQAGAPMESQP